jgi:uncharacterized membrane protein
MCLMNFISAIIGLLICLCFNVQFSQPYKRDAIAKILHTFNWDCVIIITYIIYIIYNQLLCQELMLENLYGVS